MAAFENAQHVKPQGTCTGTFLLAINLQKTQMIRHITSVCQRKYPVIVPIVLHEIDQEITRLAHALLMVRMYTKVKRQPGVCIATLAESSNLIVISLQNDFWQCMA